MTNTEIAQSTMITLANGKIGCLEFSDDKQIFSEQIKMLTDDYLANGGKITVCKSRK